MLEASILEIINRRRNGFRQRCNLVNDTREAERNFAIAEEYDSLNAEIECLVHSNPDPHGKAWSPRVEEEPSEQWILGDQGQPGG
jgi:hypothetical protein